MKYNIIALDGLSRASNFGPRNIFAQLSILSVVHVTEKVYVAWFG